MSKKNGPRSFADLFAEAEKLPEYWAAGLEIEFTEELCRVMEERGISRAELARRAGTSAAYVTKVLRGSTNFTLATMAKLARALGMEVRLHLALRGSRTVWKDELRPHGANVWTVQSAFGAEWSQRPSVEEVSDGDSAAAA